MKQRCIDSGKPGPHVLLTAGVHGDEYEPMLAAAELQGELPEKLRTGRVTIVPVTNASAYAAGSRYGSDGLDLARICPGNPEGSVSEIAAAEISALIRQSDYLVDMHTGGLAHDIYPLVGYMLHPSPEVLKTQREMAQAYQMPVIWGTDHRPNGRTLSIARDEDIPAIYLEYGGGSGLRSAVVKKYKEGFLNLLNALRMTESPVTSQSPENCYWVEDARPDSGYFQAKMPSPAEGVFLVETTPGARIKKGHRFGTLVDPYSGHRQAIPAEMDGLVLSVRVAVQVKQGDALGSILPIMQPGKVVIEM